MKLSDKFIQRVMKYKAILREVENISLEETIFNFQQDMFPEKELLIWEEMARLYSIKLKENHSLTFKQKKNIFKDILVNSFKIEL